MNGGFRCSSASTTIRPMTRAGFGFRAVSDSFPEGLVLTRGLDGCVYAYAKANWAELATRFAALDSLSRDERMIQRHSSPAPRE